MINKITESKFSRNILFVYLFQRKYAITYICKLDDDIQTISGTIDISK